MTHGILNVYDHLNGSITTKLDRTEGDVVVIFKRYSARSLREIYGPVSDALGGDMSRVKFATITNGHPEVPFTFEGLEAFPMLRDVTLFDCTARSVPQTVTELLLSRSTLTDHSVVYPNVLTLTYHSDGEGMPIDTMFPSLTKLTLRGDAHERFAKCVFPNLVKLEVWLTRPTVPVVSDREYFRAQTIKSIKFIHYGASRTDLLAVSQGEFRLGIRNMIRALRDLDLDMLKHDSIDLIDAHMRLRIRSARTKAAMRLGCDHLKVSRGFAPLVLHWVETVPDDDPVFLTDNWRKLTKDMPESFNYLLGHANGQHVQYAEDI